MDRVNTLESFIEKLHAEGVETGRQEAEQLRAAGAADAAAIVARAEATSRRIIADAEARAEALVNEGRSELALAVRDTQLELREKLSRALTMLLRASLERELTDPLLVRELLRAIVVAYARADGAGESALEIRVRPDLAAALQSSAPGMLGHNLVHDDAGFDLKGELNEAGFEYQVRDGVVAVTPESVAEKLAELVTPQLRELMRTVAGTTDTLVPA